MQFFVRSVRWTLCYVCICCYCWSYLVLKGVTWQIIPFTFTKMITTIQYWMTKGTIWQIDLFLCFEKGVICQIAYFCHLTHNLSLVWNVDLVHIYVTFLHTIEMLYSYKNMSHTYIQVSHSYIQVSYYYKWISQFYITKSHPYSQKRDFYIYMSHSDIHMLNS